MFDLPVLTPRAAQQSTAYQFSGLDRRARIADGAAREMTNLSADALPCLTVRPPRGRVRTLTDPMLLAFKCGHEIVVDDGKLLVDGAEKAALTKGRKVWAVIQNRVCIWPDKVLYDAAADTVEPLEAAQESASAVFTGSTLTLDADAVFRAGDGVTISGCAQTYNNRTVVVQAVEGKTLTVYDNVFQYGEPGDDPPESWTETNITLTRAVPALDFVCEKDNRLWGTHDNAICCCKLGDPFNWNVFNGLSTDAWETEAGSDGAFTGIAAFSSHIIAFKEHIAHKVYGQKPSAFQMQVAHIEGVKPGCERSIVNLNENILYLSHSGVMAYAGGVPECVSAQLTDNYTGAAAGRLAEKYYLSAARADGTHEMLVFDTEQGVWMREDDTAARAFWESGGKLYWITGDALWCSAGDAEQAVPWRVTFGPYERVTAERQTVARLHVIMDVPPGSGVLAEIRFDDGPWTPARRIRNAQERTLRIPFVPRRCETFSVRLSGQGPVTLRSIVRKTYEGSDQSWHNT